MTSFFDLLKKMIDHFTVRLGEQNSHHRLTK